MARGRGRGKGTQPAAGTSASAKKKEDRLVSHLQKLLQNRSRDQFLAADPAAKDNSTKPKLERQVSAAVQAVDQPRPKLHGPSSFATPSHAHTKSAVTNRGLGSSGIRRMRDGEARAQIDDGLLQSGEPKVLEVAQPPAEDGRLLLSGIICDWVLRDMSEPEPVPESSPPTIARGIGPAFNTRSKTAAQSTVSTRHIGSARGTGSTQSTVSMQRTASVQSIGSAQSTGNARSTVCTPLALAAVINDLWKDNKGEFAAGVGEKLLGLTEAFSEDLGNSLAQLPAWLHGEAREVLKGHHEKDMYPWIKHLHVIVAHHVRYYVAAMPDTAREKFLGKIRLILPYDLSDRKPSDSDDGTRYDVPLACRPAWGMVAPIPGRPTYRDTFAIIEAKDTGHKQQKQLDSSNKHPMKVDNNPAPSRKGKEPEQIGAREAGPSRAPTAESATGSATEPANPTDGGPRLDSATYQASVQLFQYTRQMYATQPDRRFAWGMTLCGSKVRVVIFTSAGAVGSHEMDLCTEEGLREYVQLVVNWSLCDEHQLGYDPTIKYLSEHDCWSIEVPRTLGNGAKTYYFDDMYVSADRLFGRHTRCFPALDSLPAGKAEVEKDGSIKPRIVPQVLIKDSWAYVGPGGELGELVCLQELSVGREDDMPKDGLPKLCNGGVVKINGIEDTTTSIHRTCPDLFKGKSDYFNRHIRVAISPVGEPLSNVHSVYEFIAVMADAAAGHQLAHDQYDILHRDVSVNNIMFWREGNEVHGFMIDFDNSVRASDAQRDHRPICTGTLPFMSVNNLEKSMDVPRTALDDIESFLYVSFWQGTWGVTREHRQAARARDRHILKNEGPQYARTVKREISTWSDMVTALDKKIRLIDGANVLNAILGQLFHTHPTEPSFQLPDGERADVNEAYELLAGFMVDLRESLFHSSVDGVPDGAKGGSTRGGEFKSLLSSMSAEITNPFIERAKKENRKPIYKRCVEVAKLYGDEARRRRDEKIAENAAAQASGSKDADGGSSPDVTMEVSSSSDDVKMDVSDDSEAMGK